MSLADPQAREGEVLIVSNPHIVRRVNIGDAIKKMFKSITSQG